MWQQIRKAGWMLVVATGVNAQTQPEYAPETAPAVQVGASNDQPPVAPATIPNVPPSGDVLSQTQPLPVARPVLEQDTDTAALRQLSMDVARTQGEVQLLGAQVAAQDARKKLQPFATGTSDIPQLIGLFGVGTDLTAQFAVGTNVLDVRAGEWITTQWRVERVTSMGVELRDRKGRAHTALFGSQPVTGGTPVMLQPQPQMQGQAQSQYPLQNGQRH